jgi:hypothetical protein
MYDRQTETLWNHFTGKAVTGHLTGAVLDVFPDVHRVMEGLGERRFMAQCSAPSSFPVMTHPSTRP